MKKKEQSDTGRRRASGEPASAGACPSGSIAGKGCRRGFLCTIQRYEAGEQSPTQEVLLKMKACYGCEFSDLFPEELA